MKKFLKMGVLSIATAASVLAMSSPAEARRYYGRGYGHYGHSGNTGAALAGGIIGLALGAAIANDGRGYRGGGYGYRGDYYRNDYRRGYAYNRPYRGYRGDYQWCRTERFYDDYTGETTTVRRCN